jgi:hypothetical protein
VQKGDTR